MTKKLIELAIAILVVGAGIWLAMTSSALPEQLQWFLLATLVLVLILFVIFPKIPIDYKIICGLILGYAFAGKGFAYITPFEPVYIGEIVWIIGMLGYIYRLTKGATLCPTWMHIMILIWMATVGLYLYAGFPRFGTLAIRDSAVGYYAMFAFYGYAIFSRNDLSVSFGRVLKLCVVGGCFSELILNTGLYHKIASKSALISSFVIPHPDSFIALVAAGGMYGLLEGVRKKSILRLLLGSVAVMLIFSTKTAGVFCMILLVGYFITIGRRMDILFTTGTVALMVAVALGFMISFGSTRIEEMIRENDTLQTFYIGETGNGTGSVNTDWRIAWWTIVTEDTLANNPLFGSGLGSDISSHFLQSYMRSDLNTIESKTYARYPHNIIFTVFGRMGFVGLSVFILMISSMLILCIKITRKQLSNVATMDNTTLLALLVFMAGQANAYVQSTYEVPYGAITNWLCLGYLLAAWSKRHELKVTKNDSVSPHGETNSHSQH